MSNETGSMDFIHKLIVVLISISATVGLTIALSIINVINNLHDEVSNTHASLSVLNSEVQHVNRRTTNLKEDLKEHIRDSRSLMNRMKSRTHSGGG